MAHPQSEGIHFDLQMTAEKLKDKTLQDEEVISAYIKAGMPVAVACDIVSKCTNSAGQLEPELFVECIQERLDIADLLHDLFNEKALSKEDRKD